MFLFANILSVLTSELRTGVCEFVVDGASFARGGTDPLADVGSDGERHASLYNVCIDLYSALLSRVCHSSLYDTPADRVQRSRLAGAAASLCGADSTHRAAGAGSARAPLYARAACTGTLGGRGPKHAVFDIYYCCCMMMS